MTCCPVMAGWLTVRASSEVVAMRRGSLLEGGGALLVLLPAGTVWRAPESLRWTAGQDLLGRYDVPGRSISSAFCRRCGSPMPYLSLSGRAIVVPAGSLDAPAPIAPQDHIFWSERASWFEAAGEASGFGVFPACV